jgi:hypothetical protein
LRAAILRRRFSAEVQGEPLALLSAGKHSLLTLQPASLKFARLVQGTVDVSRAVIRAVPDASAPTPFALQIEAGVKTSCLLCAQSLHTIQVLALALLFRTHLANPGKLTPARTLGSRLLTDS